MNKKTENVNKMNGGGALLRLKKYLQVIAIMLLIVVNVKAEVPHSYITENPSKEITVTDTVKKYKEKAELNISVTKLKSKEIMGQHDPVGKLIRIVLDNSEYGITSTDKIYLSEKLEEVPAVSTTAGKRKLNKLLNSEILKEGSLEYEVNRKETYTEVRATYKELPKDLYIGIVGNNYEIKNMIKVLFNKVYLKEVRTSDTGVYNFEIEKNFTNGGDIYFNKTGISSASTGITFKNLSGTAFPHSKLSILNVANIVQIQVKKNSGAYKTFFNDTSYTSDLYHTTNMKIDEDTEITLGQWGSEGSYYPYISLLKIPKKDFMLTFYLKKYSYQDDMMTYVNEYTITINFKSNQIMLIKGESNLNVSDQYNKEQYITFNSSTIENPKDISLETAITGTGIYKVSGSGLVTLEQGDILEINGQQFIAGIGGAISEKSLSLNGVKLFYKAENGKFKLKVSDYNLEQESPQVLNLKIIRDNNEIMNHSMNIYVPKIYIDSGKMNLKITDDYKGGYFNLHNLPSGVSGIKFLEGKNYVSVYTPRNKPQGVFEYLKINGKNIYSRFEKKITKETINANKVRIQTEEDRKDLIVSLSNYSKKTSEPSSIKFESNVYKESEGSGSDHSNGTPSGTSYNARLEIVFYYIPNKIEGNSTLKVDEYYSVNGYIAFNSCTTPDPKNISLENSLKDVAVIQNSGYGLVNLEENDVLNINGEQSTIGVGGNLQEKEATIGNLKFRYKVESGKFRIALKEWGILEPDRNLRIQATRDGNDIMDHTMSIKAPRRVEGVSNLKFTEKYPIREIVRLQGISLTAPGIMNLETPIPAGVSLKAVEGYGIPFLKEGDILEIGNNLTRAAKQYVIGAGENLKKTTVELPNTTLTMYVENGKVRLGLDNWSVNKHTSLNLRAVRGTNEISNNTITLAVPEAPFDMLKNGVLDFGTILAGSKNKYAETDIVLEMLQDVTEVKYSLSTSEPELENPNGKKLKAKDIKAIVLKQGNRRYLLKVQGYLDVPKEQQLGEYRGSMILNVNIK